MVEFLLALAAGLAGVAFLLALWRFFQGPTAADRVVAFDVLTQRCPVQLARRCSKCPLGPEGQGGGGGAHYFFTTAKKRLTSGGWQ